MTLHVLARSLPRRMPPARPAYVPRPRARWLPTLTIAEIEPRITDAWVFVHKIENIRDEGGNPVTAWFSDREMRTSQSDTPSDTRFRELIDDPGDYQWRIFGNGRVPGIVTPTWGSVTYKNTDDYFGYWTQYATDGGKLTCWFGPVGGVFPAEFRKVFIAYIDGYPDVDEDSMKLSLRGRERLFDRRVVTTGFSDSLGSVGGIDLETAGIPGSRMQQVVMGTPPPFRPILTNATDYIWFLQANPTDGVTATRLFDGGIELTSGGGIGSTSFGGGYFNSHAPEHGPVVAETISQVRVELRALTTGYYSSPTVSLRPWDICTLATLAGVPVDVTRMASGSTNYGCGNRVVEAQTVKDVLNDVAAYNVASIGFTRLDEFYARPITPSFDNTPTYTFRDAGTYPDGDAERYRTFRLPGMQKRVYALKVRGGETSRSALVAETEAIDADILDMLSRDGWMVNFTAEHAFNSGAPFFQRTTILDSDPTAEIMEVEIKGHEFVDEATMLAFSARLMALHGSRNLGCSWEAWFSRETMALGPLDCVTIQTTRFGGARNAILVGAHAQLKRKRILFTGWSHVEEGAPVAGEISIVHVDDTQGAGGSGAGSGAAGRGDAAPQLMHEFVLFGDKTTALAVGESTVDFFFPFDGTLVVCHGGATTPQTAGSPLTYDMKINGVSVLSTLITVDNNERSTYTAGTLAVISAPSVLKGDRATFHITQVGTGGKGGWVQFVWYPR